MDFNSRNAVLAMLATEAQHTAPIKIQLNWTKPNGVVHSDYIVVMHAPPSVVTRIVRECVMVDLIEGAGLLIPVKDV